MSDILDRRNSLVRCVCEPLTAKWSCSGRYYTVTAEYTDFRINALDQICLLNADKSVEFYTPDSCLLMHYDIQQRTMYGAAHRLAFDDRISYVFSMNGRLHWFYGGKLYSAPFEPWSVSVEKYGSYMLLSRRTAPVDDNDELLLCEPNGGVIARWKNIALTIRSKPVTEHKVPMLRVLEQYKLIAAVCDTEGSGYADMVMLFDFDGRKIAEISAAKQGYSCIYCLDCAGLSCPCISFLKERPGEISYNYASGFNITSHDIDPSWYDILYSGKDIELKYAYGMTQKFYHYNVVECR